MMKNRIIAFVVIIIAIVGAVVGYNVYRQRQNQSSSQQSTTGSSVSTAQSSRNSSVSVDKEGKTLIVYFSRKDGVSDGPLTIGHTKRVADFIQDRTDGDEYEIVPAKDYPKEFQATADQAEQEQADNARPKIKNKLPDVSQYDNIFIGSPVWWSEYPMIVHTFLDGVNLDGKNVFPFTTHKGSGMGSTEEVLAQQFPDANISEGLAIEGTEAARSRSEVNTWLADLGF